MIIYKFSFILLSLLYNLIISVKSEEWPSPKFVSIIKPVVDKCISSIGIDPAVVEKARKGDIPDDDKFKNYLLCVFEDFHWINHEHHDFEYWKILAILPQEMKKPAFELAKGCLHIKDEDYPKASLEFVKCLQKANSEHFAFLF